MPNRGLVGARDPPARTLPGGCGPRDSIQVTLIYPATRGIRRWGAPAPAAHVGGGGMADMRQKPVRRRGGRQRTPTWPVMVLTCSNRGPLYVNCSTWSIARPPAAPRRAARDPVGRVRSGRGDGIFSQIHHILPVHSVCPFVRWIWSDKQLVQPDLTDGRG